jgi:hypothetical protein
MILRKQINKWRLKFRHYNYSNQATTPHLDVSSSRSISIFETRKTKVGLSNKITIVLNSSRDDSHFSFYRVRHASMNKFF